MLRKTEIKPQLYGVTDTDNIYTIDPKTGDATFVSKLSVSFDGGFQSGLDFNPVIDRLRLTGSNDQRFAVNVDTGVVAVGGNLNYASGARMASRISSTLIMGYKVDS